MAVLRHQILVKLWVWEPERIPAILASCGAMAIDGKRLPMQRLVRALVPEGADPDAVLAALRAHPEVNPERTDFEGTATPVATFHAGPIGDPVTSWHLFRTGVLHAWKTTKGDPVVKLIAIDSGILPHEDLPGIAPEMQYHAVTETNDATDIGFNGEGHGHGLSVLGIMVGLNDNGLGCSGLAPGVTPGIVAVANSDGLIPGLDVIEAIIKAAQIGGASDDPLTLAENTIINLSLGSFHPAAGDAMSAEMHDALAWARGHGCLIFASAGNEGYDLDTSLYAGGPYHGQGVYMMPCEDPNVIAVGARDQADYRSHWDENWEVSSNYGAAVRLVAPGTTCFVPAGGRLLAYMSANAGPFDVFYPGQPYAGIGGTSFSSPISATVAALVWSVNPALSRQEVEDIVLGEARRDPGLAYENPNAAGHASHAKAEARALATLDSALLASRFPQHAGKTVFPVAHFVRPSLTAVIDTLAAGASTTRLASTATEPVIVDLAAYSSEPVTSVELWCGTTRVYVGAPRAMKLAATYNGYTNNKIRVVGRAGAGVGDETYDDVIATSLSLSGYSSSTGLSLNTVPAPVNQTVTVTGGRALGQVITVECPTGTVGAVTYPTSTTWACAVSEMEEGENVITVAIGLEVRQATAYVPVVVTGSLGAAVAVGFQSYASDAYYLTRGSRVGLSYVAGPWAYIDWPQGSFGYGARFGHAPSSAFSALWQEAATAAAEMGFASLSAFAAAWHEAQALAAYYGVEFGSDYYVADNDAAEVALALGFESVSAFSAAWSSAQALTTRLGFASVAQFVAVWEEAALTGLRLGLSAEAVWYAEGEGAATIGARFGVAASSSYWEGLTRAPKLTIERLAPRLWLESYQHPGPQVELRIGPAPQLALATYEEG